MSPDPANAGADPAVNSDHPAIHIEQRTTRITPDHRTIGADDELRALQDTAHTVVSIIRPTEATFDAMNFRPTERSCDLPAPAQPAQSGCVK